MHGLQNWRMTIIAGTPNYCINSKYIVVIYTGIFIRESVDSLCRDGADAQYMQYLSKNRITLPQIR